MYSVAVTVAVDGGQVITIVHHEPQGPLEP